MTEPRPDQLAIARRVGNRLSEKLPPTGVMDWTDVQQMALEALLEILAKDKVPEEPSNLGMLIRSRTIDALRKEGVLDRVRKGDEVTYELREAPTLDDLPPYLRDSLLGDDEREAALADEGLSPKQIENRLGQLPGNSPLPKKTRRRTPTEKANRCYAIRLLRGGLTERESEVLACAAAGATREETAEYLSIGIETVSDHRTRAAIALRAKNITQAVSSAYRRGLID